MHLRLFLAVAALSVSACSSAMKTAGSAQQNQLKPAVQAASQAQKDAGKEFQDLLSYFEAMTGLSGGSHVTSFPRALTDLQECEAQAAVVHQQMLQMDAAARSGTAALPGASRRQWTQVSSSLHASASSMDTVLAQLRSQTQYLKENLNASGIGSMRGRTTSLQRDIQRLRVQIARATAAADHFTQSL